jgi:hypothetical protein
MRLPSRAEVRALLTATVTVAALDLSYVWVLWVLIRQRITTEQLLQSIATGLLGRDAYQGGPPTAILGGALHLLIAAIWCTIFWLILSRAGRLRAIASQPVGLAIVGICYGMLVWWGMDLVVLPLSRARPVPIESWTFVINTVQHAIMIGLPIALIVGGTMTARTRLQRS